jgi:hypothetical protein
MEAEVLPGGGTISLAREVALMNQEIERLLQDATLLQKRAEVEFGRDHRNATERAWAATRAAAEAMYMKIEGRPMPENRGRAVRSLSEKIGKPFVWQHFVRAMRELHRTCTSSEEREDRDLQTLSKTLKEIIRKELLDEVL